MSIDSPRIAELRRRVAADPASMAFAQLAEEYRRAGAYDEAVATCRAGLIHHPGYLSAHVTLGRTLIETGQLEEAERELDIVLRAAPDNLAAIRGMGEIYQRRGSLGQALTYYRRALQLARHDPELEDAVDTLAREVGDSAEETPGSAGLSLEQLERELLRNVPVTPAPMMADLDDIFHALGGEGEQAPPQVEAILAAPVTPAAPFPPAPEAADDLLAELENDLRRLVERRADSGMSPDPPAAEAAVLDELERWLSALQHDRQRRLQART